MSIYDCPHCGERSFNPWTKARAGQLNSKGKPCMKCGRLCVNGSGATVFNAIYCTIAFICIIFIYLNGTKDTNWVYRHEVLVVMAIIISICIVPKLVNAFFFKMSPAIRIEPKK